MLNDAINKIKPETIRNFWAHSNILSPAHNATLKLMNTNGRVCTTPTTEIMDLIHNISTTQINDYMNCEPQVIIDSIDLNVYTGNIIEALDTTHTRL